MDLHIIIEQLQVENKILRQKLVEVNNKVEEKEKSNVIEIKKSIRDLVEEIESQSIDEELKEELTIFKPLASLTEKEKKVVITLWKYNGLTAKQLHKLVLRNIKHFPNVYKVLQRLESEGHIRRIGRMYKSKYNLGPRKNKGHVYVLKEFQTNTYKIGKSKKLEKRLKLFNVKLPFETELITSVEFKDYDLAEKLMHERFDNKRVGDTEWFHLSEEDLKMIEKRNLPQKILNLIVDNN